MTSAQTCEPPLLNSTRLSLRGITATDTPALFEIYSDRKTLEYWGKDPVKTPAEAWAMIEENLKHVADGSALLWGITPKETGQLIGTCVLFRINRQNRNAELGYILNRKYWGKGLMTEALTCLLNHAFDTLDLHRLEADTDPDNSASLAVLEKLGFQREGYFRERWFVHGKWHDSVMLGLIRSEFP
jgi:ribosomal-protein-alanine N-acetyltransferase